MAKDAKEKKEMLNLPILDALSLEKGKTYFSNENHLIQVQYIYPEKQEFYLFNISEQFHQLVPFNRHNLVKLVR